MCCNPLSNLLSVLKRVCCVLLCLLRCTYAVTYSVCLRCVCAVTDFICLRYVCAATQSQTYSLFWNVCAVSYSVFFRYTCAVTYSVCLRYVYAVTDAASFWYICAAPHSQTDSVSKRMCCVLHYLFSLYMCCDLLYLFSDLLWPTLSIYDTNVLWPTLKNNKPLKASVCLHIHAHMSVFPQFCFRSYSLACMLRATLKISQRGRLQPRVRSHSLCILTSVHNTASILAAWRACCGLL